MIVTQSRHIWSLSKASKFFNNNDYKIFAEHGYNFLKDKMWDCESGGFFQMRNYKGEFTDYLNFYDEKRTYGNAFAVYGLAALYEINNDINVLEFSKKIFNWIEEHSFDPEYKGYFQFLTKEGIPFDNKGEYKTEASDKNEVGLKDQNSSIHLLEAYTELYNVWKDEKLKEKLNELLILIRDVITNNKGNLILFFEKDWTPVSFRNFPKEVREKNYGLDHVSFGHNYETAFLMLEASYVLQLENDIKTLSIAKKMMDHAIEYGWDYKSAGFFDEGYYFDEIGNFEIIKDTKVWWAQAEGLNALLLFSKIFPEEKKYYDLFEKLWEYVKEFLLDDKYGDWYWGSLEKNHSIKKNQKEISGKAIITQQDH